MPSRRDFPPPNFASSPLTVRSFSTSMISEVSARRILSPAEAPNISAYCFLVILNIFAHPLESSFFCFFERRLSDCVIIKASFHEAVQAESSSFPANLNKAHSFCFSRFKTHCRTRRDVQPHPICQPTVELELFIYLKEMKVGSDLAGTIRCIGNIDLHRIFSFI